MVYVNPIDPTKPADTDPAGSGDDQIRELKAALIERFQTVFPNFPDGDPLKLAADLLASKAGVGTLAERPNPPTEEGELYWSTDEDVLYVSVTQADASIKWEVAAGGQITGGASDVIWHLVDQAGLASTHYRVDSAPQVLISFAKATTDSTTNPTQVVTFDLNRIKDTRLLNAGSWVGFGWIDETHLVFKVTKVADGTQYGRLDVTVGRRDGTAIPLNTTLYINVMLTAANLANAVDMAV